MHALDGLRLALVDAGQLATEHGTRGDGGDLHPGQAHVDAVLRSALYFCWSIEPLGRRADQREVLRILERDLRGHRQLCGPVDERAIHERTTGGRVGHDAPVRPARRRIDVPGLRCRGDEHAARGRACPPHRLVQFLHGRRGSGHLKADERIGIQLVVGWRVLDLDLVEPYFELLRQEHGHRRVRALAHLNLPDDHRHAAVPADTDERVRRERRRCRLGGRRDDSRPRVDTPPQEQSAAGGSTRKQQLPTGHAFHGQPPLSAVECVCAARLMASRMRG